MELIFASPSTGVRQSSAELLAGAFERHGAELVAYFAARLESAAWHVAEDLAAEVWVRLAAARVADVNWLRLIVASVWREHTATAETAIPAGLSGRDLPAIPPAGGGNHDGDGDVERQEDDREDVAPVFAFLRSHGDPTTWTSCDFDVYEHLAETAPAARPVETVDGPLHRGVLAA